MKQLHSRFLQHHCFWREPFLHGPRPARVRTKSLSRHARLLRPPRNRLSIKRLAQRTSLQASALLHCNRISAYRCAVNDNKDAFPGAKPQTAQPLPARYRNESRPRRYLLLRRLGANGMNPNTAEFDLADRCSKYAITIQDFVGNKGPYALSIIFQDAGGWKIAGYQIRPGSAAGHDACVSAAGARYKSKGQAHNAWFYYLNSYDLLQPASYITQRCSARSPTKPTVSSQKIYPLGKPVLYCRRQDLQHYRDDVLPQ